jgi:hypothetical protein
MTMRAGELVVDNFAGGGALRGVVSRWTRLKGGGVSVVLTFAPVEAQNAFSVVPGQVVEVVRL